MRNKFRENTSEIKIPLLSKAFTPPNQHILSFVYDVHPLSLKPVRVNGYFLFAEVRRKASTGARIPGLLASDFQPQFLGLT